MSSQIASGMLAGHIKSIGNTDVNIAIYSKAYQHLTGRAFKAGQAVGNFRMVVNGGSKISSNRFGSTLASTSSCSGDGCQEYCGSVCTDGGGCHQDCTHDCISPTDPSTPGPPPGGGYGGDTGGGGYGGGGTSDDGTTSSGPGTTPDNGASVGDHATLCEGKYLAGKIKILVETTNPTHIVEKMTLFYTGVLPPGATVTQRGDGVASYNGSTNQYSMIIYFNVTGFDKAASSKEGYYEIYLSIQPDYFSEKGYTEYYTMIRHGG